MIMNLAQIHEALQRMAYPVKLTDEAVVTSVGKFPTVVTINDNDEVVITCQIATLGDVHEDRMHEFSFAALDMNSRISPFAISIITAADDPTLEESQYPVILVDNLPIGDLSEDELEKSFASLHSALLSCRSVILAGIAPPESVTA